MSSNLTLLLIPLLPLASFLLLGLFGKKYFKSLAGIAGTISLLVSAALSLVTANQYFFVSGKVDGVYQRIVAFNMTWLRFSPGLSIVVVFIAGGSDAAYRNGVLYG